MIRISFFIAVSGLALLAACTQQPDNAYDTSKVLVRVNGEPITEYELVINIETLFGKGQPANRVKETERKKILESMIMSRLIRQQAEKSLDESRKSLFEQKALIYKEKIIVNDYLKNNIKYAPVTNEMVTAYYNKHPEKFGGEQILHYELLTTKNKLSEIDRDKLLGIYVSVKKTDDMVMLQKHIAEKGMSLSYHKGRLRPGVLDAKIESVLASLKQGETSVLSMQKGRPYIIKLVERKQQAPKSLSSVATAIRKQLAPMALKQSIKQETDKLKESAKIEYLTDFK